MSKFNPEPLKAYIARGGYGAKSHVARMLNLTPASLYNYLKGNTQPILAVQDKISKLLAQEEAILKQKESEEANDERPAT